MVKQPTFIALPLLLAAGACGQSAALRLEIHAPCNGTALETNGVAYVELSITAPDLDSPVRATFGAGAAQGSIDGVAAVSHATFEVAGHAADRSGGVGDVVVAGGLGYVDLSSNPSRVALIAGQVKNFIRVTPTGELGAACAEQQTARAAHTASLLDDGRVLISGGYDDKGPLSTSEIYVPRDGQFVAGPAMRVARSGHTSTTLIGGRVIVAGGLDAGGKPAGSLEVFDGSTFARSIAMDGRAFHTATRLQDGRVLLAGGVGQAGVMASTAIYDPKSDSVRDGPTLKAPRARHAAVLVSDSVVALVGGIDQTSTVGLVEFVDVDAGKSTSGPILQTPRSDAAVWFLTAKRAIVVAGGYGQRVTELGRGTAITSIEVIDVASDPAASSVLCSDANLSTARAAAAVAPIPHGFLVAGGSVSPGEVSSGAEALTFDAGPCRPTIDATGDLFASRFSAVATPLVSGDLLVTGGATLSSGTVSSRKAAEIFIIPR